MLLFVKCSPQTSLGEKWWRVALKPVCIQSLFGGRIGRRAYQVEELCAALCGFWFGRVLFILDSILGNVT